MNAMSLQLTSSTMRAAWLAIAALLATTASVAAAEADKKAEESQAETERKLEDARRRLDAAAREVAELSMSMSEFAAPMSRPFLKSVRERAMLGINLGAGGEDLAEGVQIVSVSPGGAAESAGLKSGDVLLKIGGKALKRDGEMSPRDVLMKEIGQVKPGEKVELRYRRDDKVVKATVTARAAMDRMHSLPMAIRGHSHMAAPAMPFPPPGMMRAVGVFGSAELVPLTPQLGQYFGTEKGLLVVRAPTDSRLKLEDGDVIVDIDGRTPANPTHAFRILSSYQAGEQLKLNVLRQKKRMSVEIAIPDEPSADSTGLMLFQREPLMPRPSVGVGPGPGMEDRIMIAPAPMPPPPPAGDSGFTILTTIEDDPA
jgi:S1-C subfamily serine protease